MHLDRRVKSFNLSFLIALLGAYSVGCPSATPASQLPVQLVGGGDPVAADECTTIGASVTSGASGVPMASHAPVMGRILSSRCEDESICATEPLDESRVLVRGKAPGQTEVDVSYEHPETHERGEGRVKVSFTPPPPVDALHPRVVGANDCARLRGQVVHHEARRQ